MEKDMIESYLNTIEKDMYEGRVVSAHRGIRFLLKNLYNLGEKKITLSTKGETQGEKS